MIGPYSHRWSEIKKCCRRCETSINIPSETVTEIVSWLPPKAAIRCRCVCKDWLKLLSDAEFVNLHLSRSPPPSHLMVLQRYFEPPDSPSFNLLQIEDDINHHSVRRIAPMDSGIRWNRLSRSINMTDSINGLICVEEYSIRQVSYKWKPIEFIHVWNPIMGEYITIETLGGYEQRQYIVTSYGFGISSSGNYRLVMISEETEMANSLTPHNGQPVRVLDSTCHVYTIGAGSWKCIGPTPYLHICRYRRGRRRPEPGLFFNGNIHWLPNDDDHPEQICCFNLDTELFQPFPPLPKTRPTVTLNIYKGCLSACDYNPYQHIVIIWVMKEYGLQNSWSKEVVITKDFVGRVGGYFEDVYIIKVFKDGEIWLQWREGPHCVVYSYHPHRKTMQLIDINEPMTGPGVRYNPWFQVKEYVPSIVSLKSLGEINVNKM